MAGVNHDSTTDVHHQNSVFRSAVWLEEQTIYVGPGDEVTWKHNIALASIFTKIHYALNPDV